MNTPFTLRLALLVIALVNLPAVRGADILYTSDNEGHVGPCSTCPAGHGRGGLEQRATVLKPLRNDPVGTILVDGGNSFFGGESAATRGQIIAGAFDAMGYDAVNLSYRDFRYGKARTLELMQAAKFDVISANLLDADTAKPIAKPFVVKTIGGKKIAIIGLTQRPAALDVLPTLKQQLAGVTIAPPAKALGDILPQAKASADEVVVVYYGSIGEARALLTQFGPDLSAFLVGGVEPEDLGDSNDIIAVARHGTSIARCHLVGRGQKLTVEPLSVDASTAGDPAMKTLLAQFQQKTAAPIPAAPATAPAGAGNGFTTVFAGGRTDSIRVNVSSFGFVNDYGGISPPVGSRFLVINASLENLLPPVVVDNKIMGNTYVTPKLYDRISVIADGRRLARRDGPTLPGEFPDGPLELSLTGSTASGKILLIVPATFSPSQLILYYDDKRAGKAAVALIGELPAGDIVVAPAPVPATSESPVAVAPATPTTVPLAIAPDPSPSSAPAPDVPRPMPAPTVAEKPPVTTPPAPAPAPSPAMPAPTPAPISPVASATNTPAVNPLPVPRPIAPAPPADVPAKPLRVTARQDREPRGLAGVGLTAEQVNTAIDTGAAALYKFVRDNDFASGQGFDSKQEDNLAALALVHAGYHKKNAECDAAIRQFIEQIDPRSLGSYRSGVLMMLIEAYGDTRYLPKMRDAARYLLESQGSGGTWSYSVNLPANLFEPVDLKRGVLHAEGGIPLDQPIVQWKRMVAPLIGGGDNSTTQFAMLGLAAASRSGIKLPNELWDSAMKTTISRQCTDGGWGYTDARDVGYGSMTSAGICAMAMCRFELGEKTPAVNENIERGLAWLDSNFSVSSHPGNENDFFYYYMYGLERVGRILDTEFIGGHEWYPLGARALVDAQKPDHLWPEFGTWEKNRRLTTSFALLFLTRATPSLLQPKHNGPGSLLATTTPPPGRFYIILDASGSMLDNMDGKMKFNIARDAVWGLVNNLPDQTPIALRVYGHRKNSLQPDADLDTQLLIPMGPLNKRQFKAALDGLRSRGKTPLTLSLQQSLADIGQGDPRHPLALVLLTDGGEDTFPRHDPVKAAALLKNRPDIHLHIIGFDINQQDWSEQLQAMARVSGGDYTPAAKAADLDRSLASVVLGVPESFQVFDTTGRLLASNPFGSKVGLAEGHYTFRTVLAGHPFTQDFWINGDVTTSVVFDGAQAMDSLATTPAAAPPSVTIPSAPSPAVASPAHRFCTHCGAPLPPGAKFCSKCGTKILD